jgi:hypothetical protein
MTSVRTLAVRLLVALAVAAVCSACGDDVRTTARKAPAGLYVRGNRLLDRSGRVVHFHGVNRSGSEYACVQGWGIFDGPSNDASIAAIARWKVNIVRVPVNEQCWLGLGRLKPRYSGAAYRRALVAYVRRLHRHGLYAEVSLMWAAPGKYPATYQSGGPDADHSPALWRSLAATFKNDPDVILAPWGETVVDARCFQRGGVCEATFGPHNVPYRVAGMQQAVTVMRRAGYRGVIAIPGINYANDLSHWLARRPRDPLHQLVAEAHVYGNNVCGGPACFNRTIAPVARRVPVIFGEAGETYDDSSCGHAKIAAMLRWADAHGVGYETWAWDTWRTCGSLISSYAGTPHADYGAYIRARYIRTAAAARRLP